MASGGGVPLGLGEFHHVNDGRDVLLPGGVCCFNKGAN